MSTRKTMGGHIESTRLRVYDAGGENPISSRDERINSIIFDGQPLSDHDLPSEKEAVKRINEMLGAAYALVGADLDHEVRELRSLATRPGLSTPDFEAILSDDRVVRMETCALASEVEQKYLDALSAIANSVNAAIISYPEVLANSPYFVRFYGRVVDGRDVESASNELFDLLLKNGPAARRTSEMQPVSAEYRTLYDLQTFWTHLDDKAGRRGVVLDPLRCVFGEVRPGDLFPTLLAKKAAKYDQYSDGGTVPVWLAIYLRTSLTYPSGDVASIIAERLDPSPFDRLIIGSKTIGKYFDRE